MRTTYGLPIEKYIHIVGTSGLIILWLKILMLELKIPHNLDCYLLIILEEQQKKAVFVVFLKSTKSDLRIFLQQYIQMET
jgi:hypothetical protein